MKRVIMIMIAVMAALAMFGPGTVEARDRDAGATSRLAQQDQPIVLAEVSTSMRGTRRIPDPPIKVSRYLTGRVITRGNMLTVTFQVEESLMSPPIFQFLLRKGRARTVKMNWMGASRIDPPRTYMSQRRIPAGFDTGNDFFVEVIHQPTNKKGFSGLFTIR